VSVPESTKRRDDVLVLEDAKVKAKTRGAVLCDHEAINELDKNERWIPWSQVDDDSEIMEASNVGDVGDLVVSDWIAEKKGLL
jgi:hypothetical protein